MELCDSRLTKIGNSWGLIIPREVLELLGIEGEVEVQVVVLAIHKDQIERFGGASGIRDEGLLETSERPSPPRTYFSASTAET